MNDFAGPGDKRSGQGPCMRTGQTALPLWTFDGIAWENRLSAHTIRGGGNALPRVALPTSAVRATGLRDVLMISAALYVCGGVFVQGGRGGFAGLDHRRR